MRRPDGARRRTHQGQGLAAGHGRLRRALREGRTTVIPAATVIGGGGGGNGRGPTGGEGGGFGILARPAGAFVIRDGTVQWVPAVDPNWLVGTVTAVALVFGVRLTRRKQVRAR
ncbi:hypothetical protein [Actinophytocola sp.]|uniref:hypothetical protein n=1 Tax=Actinophytocola sp. TaxID=1872138 RepID=UPI0025BAC3A2|nr:hypothetical protein [Actinophytocola sp.]